MRTLFTLCIFLSSFSLCAQCLSGGITFSTQTDIDDFSTNYPGCTEILGGVTIQESSPGEITDLSGLSQLTKIGSDLYIYINTALSNLSGLNSLTLVEGDLYLYDNDALLSLSALENITAIDGFLGVDDNDALTNLSGIHNIDHSTIVELYLISSTTLATCEISSICNYLAAVPANPATISGNAVGCNTKVEIETICASTGCLSAGITFTTQAEIDAFSSIYSGCTLISGDVQITGTVTDLSGLSQLTSIGGYLSIYNNAALTDLSGLDNLTSVGGFLNITNNSGLTSLSGLGSLASIGGEFAISTNASLNNLTALSGLTSIGGRLLINANTAMTSLSGLSSLATIGADLTISSNVSLASLSGLSGLTSIGTQLDISSNGSLANLSALNSLTSVGGFLRIDGNTILANLTGLGNLNAIGGVMLISNNNALSSLSGLENIDHTTITSLFIQNSTSLSTCEVASICDYLAAVPVKPAVISGNAVGCNTKVEIETACALLPVTWQAPLTAKLQDNKTMLNWSVASQINNEAFIVEHSSDGVRFEAIGEIAGDGTLETEKAFDFIHRDPTPGNNYYRIKQIDFDGKYNYSNVASVELKVGGIAIHPNPTKGAIFITAAQATQIEVYNQLGQLVKAAQLAVGTSPVDLSEFSNGIYFVKTSDGEVQKIVKR